jgi:TPR repeat protein
MTARKDLVTRGRDGDLSAQCRIAESFMAKETRGGYLRALPWLRRAASAGDPWAEYHLGLIYDHGLAGHRDRSRAARWYERAAAKGYASAQLNLGIVLANRRGRFRDLRRAVHLYRLAARQGRRNAAYNLGLYYREGRGVPKSLAQARRWYQQAADLGDREARRILKQAEQGHGWIQRGRTIVNLRQHLTIKQDKGVPRP